MAVITPPTDVDPTHSAPPRREKGRMPVGKSLGGFPAYVIGVGGDNPLAVDLALRSARLRRNERRHGVAVQERQGLKKASIPRVPLWPTAGLRCWTGTCFRVLVPEFGCTFLLHAPELLQRSELQQKTAQQNPRTQHLYLTTTSQTVRGITWFCWKI